MFLIICAYFITDGRSLGRLGPLKAQRLYDEPLVLAVGLNGDTAAGPLNLPVEDCDGAAHPRLRAQPLVLRLEVLVH